MLKILKYDPIEDTEEYKSIVEEVDKKARKIVAEEVQKRVDECKDEFFKEFIKYMPTSHRFFYEKKIILKEEYGIEWKSVIEMNPDIIFDWFQR